MKRYMLFLNVLLYTGFVVATGDELIKLSDTAITHKTITIKKAIQRDALRRGVIIAAGALASTYGAYKLLKTSDAAPVLSRGVENVPALNKEEQLIKLGQLSQNLPRMQGQLDRIDQFVQAQGIKPATSKGFFGTLKSWGVSTFSFVAREASVAIVFSTVMGMFGKYFKSFDQALDALYYKLFHAYDLTWFMSTQTTIANGFNDLERYAYCIEHRALPKKAADESALVVPDEALTESDVENYRKKFNITWALCMREIESVIAFMCIKADEQKKRTDEENPVAINYFGIAKRIYDVTHECTQDVEKLLETPNPVTLTKRIATLKLKFMEERTAFVASERMA